MATIIDSRKNFDKKLNEAKDILACAVVVPEIHDEQRKFELDLFAHRLSDKVGGVVCQAADDAFASSIHSFHTKSAAKFAEEAGVSANVINALQLRRHNDPVVSTRFSYVDGLVGSEKLDANSVSRAAMGLYNQPYAYQRVFQLRSPTMPLLSFALPRRTSSHKLQTPQQWRYDEECARKELDAYDRREAEKRAEKGNKRYFRR